MWPSTIRCFELSHADPADNLQTDQALLEAVNADPQAAALRFWESPREVVIVGRSNRIEQEVDVAACAADGVPILRRFSGGGTVLLGPGCLCYTLALPLPPGQTRAITVVTAAIMQRLAEAFHTAGLNVSVAGVSDLVYDGRKFSGNAQRWLDRAVLHHGTILYQFDLAKMARYLHLPSRQPAYRAQRAHADFVTNLPLPRGEIMRWIAAAWHAEWPPRTDGLLR